MHHAKFVDLFEPTVSGDDVGIVAPGLRVDRVQRVVPRRAGDKDVVAVATDERIVPGGAPDDEVIPTAAHDVRATTATEENVATWSTDDGVDPRPPDDIVFRLTA